jgi:hypothetical protein
MVFIIPKFEAIFLDFGVELPALTRVADQHEPLVGGQDDGSAIPGIRS